MYLQLRAWLLNVRCFACGACGLAEVVLEELEI